MPFKKLYNSLQKILKFNSEKEKFLALNQQSLAELLTFIDFADEKLTIGFVEINFAKDRDALIKILQNHPQCQEIQFKILNFSEKELRFLRDAIVEELAGIKIEKNKKLVVILIGLEKSIGMSGEYPPVLQDLNFVRDAFTTRVPHPILLFLPNYALTRLAKYAPDFWAWRAGVFHFETDEKTKDYAINQTLNSDKIRGSLKLAEKQERIDLLQRLLMEYSPDNNHQGSTNIRGCINIFKELGIVYRSIGEVEKAEDFLIKALELADDKQELAQEKSSIFYNLGWLYNDLGKIDEAIALYNQSLEIKERIGNIQGKAATLHQLARIYANRGDVDEAIALFQKSLEINQHIGNVHAKAMNLWWLGGLAQEQGDFVTAINYLQPSLEILQRLKSPDAEKVRKIIAKVQEKVKSKTVE